MKSSIARIEIEMFLAVMLAMGFSAAPQQPAPPGQIPSGFSVFGTVINSASGAPIPHAQLTLIPEFRGVEAQITTSDAAGNFAFTRLAPGRYDLSASHRGFLSQNYMQHGRYASAVVVGADFDNSQLIFQLQPMGVIAGHVYTEMGEPIRGANVMVFCPGMDNSSTAQSPCESAQTDDEGHYRFGRLSPGTYLVGVQAQPWYAQHPQTIMPSAPPSTTADNSGRGISSGFVREAGAPDPNLDVVYEFTFYGGASQLADAQPIHISAGETQPADITLTAIPARHIRIDLPLSADKNSNSFVQISLQNELGPNYVGVPVQQLQVEPGVYELAGVPPGLFHALIRPSDRDQPMQTVEIGDTSEVSVGAAPLGVIVKGVLTAEAGFAITASHIHLSMTGGGDFDAEVAPDGTFEFRDKLAPGSYTLTINAPTVHYISRMAAVGARATGNIFEIGSQDVQLSVVVSGPGSFSEVSGFAVHEGKHSPGILVVLFPQGPPQDAVTFHCDQSDGDGSFSIHNVPPGNYVIFGLDNPWNLEWENTDFLDRFVSEGQPVVLEPGKKYKLDIIALDAHGTDPGK